MPNPPGLTKVQNKSVSKMAPGCTGNFGFCHLLHPLKHHGVTQLQTEIFLESPSDNQQTMNPKGMEKTLFKDIKMVLSKNRTRVTRQVVGNPVGTRICSTYLRLQMI